MIPRDILRTVRRIEIRTSRVVTESLAGRYHSVFRGRGVEFSEVREYAPGDDARSIDWNVTSRMGQPYIKTFVEERELTVLLVVDISASAGFGTAGRLKSEVAAEVAAVIAFAAIRNLDRVGLLLFSGGVDLFLPPGRGIEHVLRVVREVLVRRPAAGGTGLGRALDTLARLQRRRGVVFIISDFLDTDWEAALGRLARRHDVIAVTVEDRLESALPRAGLIRLVDAETGGTRVVDTASARVRRVYAERAAARLEALAGTLSRAGVDRIRLRTDQPWERPLVQFFRRRERRRR